MHQADSSGAAGTAHALSGASLGPVDPASREYAQVQRLRLRTIGWNPAAEPDFDTLEWQRDLRSRLLGCRLRGRLVGTVRITPLGLGLTLSERLWSLAQCLPEALPAQVCDINRLALDVDYRGSREFASLIRAVITWGVANTDYRHATLICSERLLPLYRRVGCRILMTGLDWVAGGRSRRYALMHYHRDDFPGDTAAAVGRCRLGP